MYFIYTPNSKTRKIVITINGMREQLQIVLKREVLCKISVNELQRMDTFMSFNGMKRPTFAKVLIGLENM